MPNPEMKGMRKLRGNEDPYSVEVREKLKGTASDRRKIAQKINSIKSMTKENAEREIMLLISNPTLSALQIQRMLQKALERNLNNRTFIDLIRVMIMKHTAIFGNKNINANMNVEMCMEELEERIKQRMLEKYNIMFIERGGADDNSEYVNTRSC